jgi:hypothetical protein
VPDFSNQRYTQDQSCHCQNRDRDYCLCRHHLSDSDSAREYNQPPVKPVECWLWNQTHELARVEAVERTRRSSRTGSNGNLRAAQRRNESVASCQNHPGFGTPRHATATPMDAPAAAGRRVCRQYQIYAGIKNLLLRRVPGEGFQRFPLLINPTLNRGLNSVLRHDLTHVNGLNNLGT